MPTISNIGFNVTFDLNGTPTLRLTDTTPNAPTGLVGIFSITQPDNYTRNGDISSPDIAAAGGTFPIPLRLDSTGGVQTGQYTIKYTAAAPGYLSTDLTRIFQFTYTPAKLVMTEMFDVFTPLLKYSDDTIYQAPGWNNGTVTRTWTAVSTPTGTLTANTQAFDLNKNGQYYDTNYAITLVSSVLYTHQTYSYLSVTETITSTVNTYAQTPPSLDAIVGKITDLKAKYDSLVNNNQAFADAKADFEFAEVSFSHIIDKLKVGNTANIYVDLKDLIAVLNGNHIPPYVPTNVPIPPYDITAFTGAMKWGRITGNISDQTDLWSYITTFTQHDNYIHDQQTSSATWTVNHNMGKFPSVTIVDTAGDEVDASVHHNSNNQLTITFSAPVSGKAFLN